MKKRDIDQRLENLHNVLAYCSDVDYSSSGRVYMFSPGERICINQERGALYSQLALTTGEIFPHEVREYKIPEHLEKKVNYTIDKIQATGWGGFTTDKFLKQ